MGNKVKEGTVRGKMDAFEKRATQAEAQIEGLKKKISQIEELLQSQSKGEKAFDLVTFLEKLKQLRAATYADKRKAEDLKFENLELKDEVEYLKEELEKANYRALHLVRNLNLAEGGTSKWTDYV